MRTGTIVLVMMILGIATAVERKVERRANLRRSHSAPVREIRSTPETRRLDEALQALSQNLAASKSALSCLDQSVRSMEQLVRNAVRNRDQAMHLQNPRVLEIYEQNLVELEKEMQVTQLQKAKLVAQRDRLRAEQLTLEMQRRLLAEGGTAVARQLMVERPSPIEQMDQVSEPPGPATSSSVIVLR